MKGSSCEKEPSEAEIEELIRMQTTDAANMTGLCNIATHQIRMKDDTPINQMCYPKNQKILDEIKRQVDELIQEGCIEPSQSPYSAPVVLTKKSNGKWSLGIDYRQLKYVGWITHPQSSDRIPVFLKFGPSPKQQEHRIYSTRERFLSVEGHALRATLSPSHVLANSGPSHRP